MNLLGLIFESVRSSSVGVGQPIGLLLILTKA